MSKYNNYDDDERFVFDSITKEEIPVTVHHREWWNWEIDVFKNPLTGKWEGDAIAYGDWFEIGEDDILMYYGKFVTIPEVLELLDREESE